MDLKKKKIVVCVTGGIAAYKSASLVNELHKAGYEVQVVMTKNATEFITPLTMQTLSKRKVITGMFEDGQPADIISHIHYAQEWDAIVVAPATANCIGKAANGISDDIVTSIITAATVPVLFVPAMNTVMYENRITQDNLQKLRDCGYHILEPDSGMLACGVDGKGKMPNTKTIIDAVTALFAYIHAVNN